MHLSVLPRVRPVADATPTALDPHAPQPDLAVAARAMLVLHVPGVRRDPQVLPPVVEGVPVHVIALLPVPVDEAQDLAVQQNEAFNPFLPAMQTAANVPAGDSPAVPAQNGQIVVVDEEVDPRPVARLDHGHGPLDAGRRHGAGVEVDERLDTVACSPIRGVLG